MSLELVSFELCPYVQRVAITLHEKELSFSRRWIDLADKPDWFLEVSPLAKVPVLLVDGAALFESAVICTYLDEAFTERPMTSADPLRRAVERAWAEHASATLSAIGALYNAPDSEALETRRRDLQSRLAWVDRALDADGPWFSGPDFGLVDAAYAPVFRYLTAFDRFSAFDLLADAPLVAAWRENLARRASVARAVVDDFDQKLLAFMRRRPSELGQLARHATGTRPARRMQNGPREHPRPRRNPARPGARRPRPRRCALGRPQLPAARFRALTVESLPSPGHDPTQLAFRAGSAVAVGDSIYRHTVAGHDELGETSSPLTCGPSSPSGGRSFPAASSTTSTAGRGATNSRRRVPETFRRRRPRSSQPRRGGSTSASCAER